MSFRLGIICPSEIAFRRFLPSLQRVNDFTFVGVAIATPEEWASEENVSEKTTILINNERKKAQKFIDEYGGRIFEGYHTLISSQEVDVVYLPLPPALHFKWAKMALESGKHAFVEKPFTTSLEDSQTLLNLAKSKKLAVHENYMFIFHCQIQAIQDMILKGEIGKVRQYRISFGFPRRAMNDFRYSKALGGGALLDAGGYCLKYASWLLGESARLVCANSYYEQDFEIDIFGSCTMTNDEGTIVQMSFGMDCDYKCELEAWGSNGTITTGRVLTAPEGFEPDIIIKHNQEIITQKLPSDNAFEKSIRWFYDCITQDFIREENYHHIEIQSKFIRDFNKISKYGK